MYKCQNCHIQQGIYQKQYSVVIEKRKKHYFGNTIIIKNKRKRRIKYKTEGWEIKKELKVCERCFKGWEKKGDNNGKVQ